jgi:hypothetical protein
MMKGYPEDFTPQTLGLERFAKLVEKAPEEVVAHFRANPKECQLVIRMSYDKRYSPSTYVQEVGKRYHVGWYSSGYKAVRIHDEFAAAIADFVLFSFGKPRLATGKDEEVPTIGGTVRR